MKKTPPGLGGPVVNVTPFDVTALPKGRHAFVCADGHKGTTAGYQASSCPRCTAPLISAAAVSPTAAGGRRPVPNPPTPGGRPDGMPSGPGGTTDEGPPTASDAVGGVKP